MVIVMTRAQQIALRPMLPDDGPVLAAIFAASIGELAEDDYSQAQREAWAEAGDDEQEFAEKLSRDLTLVATIAGSAVGFVSLRGADHIQMLYVHPSVARQGVASALCDAVERLATARGTTKLTVDASDTAHDLFRRRGYSDRQRSTVTVGGEWLANTRMEKVLIAANDNPETLQ